MSTRLATHDPSIHSAHLSCRMLMCVLLLATLTIGLPSVAAPSAINRAADIPFSSALQPLTGIGGGVKAIAIVDTIAYIGEGLSFVTFDVRDPAQPRRLASLMMPAPIYGLRVGNGIAYVAYRNTEDSWLTSGLKMLDVRDPSHPIEIFSHAGTSAQLVDGLTFITSMSGLSILDLRNIASPIDIGFFALPFTTSAQIVDDRAYIVGDHKFVILDISDPAQPIQLGEYGGTATTLLYINAGQVIDTRAYIATSSGLHILDITDPAHLIMVGVLNSQPATALSLSGSRIYLNTYASPAPEIPGGLLIVDAADPANPTLLGSYTPPGGQIRQFEIVDDLAIIAARLDGLLILSLREPTNPTVLGVAGMPGETRAFVLSWPYAYIAAESGGMRIANLQDLAHPAEIGVYASFGDAQLIDLADNAVLIANADGLTVVDIRIPEAPVVQASFPLAGAPQSLRVLSSNSLLAVVYTYATSDLPFGGEMLLLDLHDLATPLILSRYRSPILTTAAALSGNLVYIATTNNTLQILDISDPVHPTLRGALLLAGTPVEVQSTGSLAYVVTAPGGLLIVDATDPDAPLPRGSYPTSTNPGGLLVVDQRAYLTTDGQLHIINVGNPAAPTRLGICTLLGMNQPGKIQIAGSRVYVSASVYVYLMGYFIQTAVVGITDPTAPTALGDHTFLTASMPQIIGSLAYYTSPGSLGESYVRVVNLDRLPKWVVLGSHTLPFAPRVRARGSGVFAADGAGGLIVYRVRFYTVLPLIYH